VAAVARHYGSTLRSYQERAQANQVIGRRGKRDDPVDELPAAVPQLPQATGLHPTKHLLDELASSLADGVARVPRRPAINRAVGLLREMRSKLQLPHAGDEGRRIVVLVATDGLRAPRRFQQRQCRLPLRSTQSQPWHTH
jgi:hypothetical protein